MIHLVNTSYTLYSLFAPISRRLRLKRFSQNFCAITCNISLLLNSFLPYFAAIPVYAEDITPTPVVESTPAPENTPSPEITIAPEPTVAPTGIPSEPTIAPTAIPTVEPTITPLVTETPTVTPVVTEEPTITPVVTLEPTTVPVVSDTPTSAPSENNNNNQSSDNNSGSSDSSPASPTPTFMLPSPTPTPTPRVVEQVCSVAGETIRDSVELDWNYDCTTDTYITREKVKLGVKYIFPKENNVTVTFTSLPKDELYRSYLKIKQVKTSDLKLPENVGNVGEYAYDITTDMFDGEFKYDITLPKNPDQTAEITYIEKSLEQAKTGVTANEINSVDKSKVEQQDNKVVATNIDHFTIYLVNATVKLSGTVNGLSQITVAPGATITVSIGVTTTGDDKNNWRSSRYEIGNNGAHCIDTTDHNGNGSYTESFDIIAPSVEGTYDLSLRAYTDSLCPQGGTRSSLTLTDAIIVEVPTTPPVTNPTLPQACGLDIALVLDVSGSIDNTELNQMKTAFKGFVDALAGTPTQFSVTKFDTTATVLQTFTSDSGLVKTKIDSASGGNYTNWQDSFVKTNSTLPNRSNPNLVIFASDGNPNRTGISGTSVSESVAVANAVTVANTIKTGGTRILALGIGTDLDLANMKAISGNSTDTGNVLTSDVISTNFSTLATQLATFATQTCGGTISIRKIITGNPNAPLNNWQFSLGGGQTYPTDAQGYTSAIPVTSGTYSVTEIQKNGYSYTSASCVKNSVPIGSPISNGVGSIAISANDIVSCTFTNNYLSTCGDGIVSVGEECDDDNDINTDSCLNTCKLAKCGDTFIGPGEVCDNGLSNTNTACTATYGNSCNYCDTTCNPHTVTGPFCGDTIVNGSEQCEGSSSTSCTMPTNGYAGTKSCNPGSCSWNSCVPTEFCGDGIKNGSEICDEGAAINGTYGHCKADCTGIGERCGDGTVNGSEQCDDGNTTNNDACTNECKLARCGDGIINQFSEQCDDGNENNTDSCTNSCKAAICGDAFVQPINNEQCDKGAGNDSSCSAPYGGSCTYCDSIKCTNETVIGPRCGDDIISDSETCDGTNLGSYSSNDFRCNNCSIELIKSTIDICHSNNSQSNPYIVNHPNKTADVGGHSGHTGPVWYPGIANHSWGDIIPPFAYIGGTFPGLNWTTEGQSIYNNGCNIPKGTLIVKKIITNDDGGTKNFSDFSFNIGATSYTFENDGQNDITLTPGKYTVTENTAVGYTTTYNNCSDITVPISGSTTCTVTNDDIAPKLKLSKIVINDNGGNKDASSWTLQAQGAVLGFSDAGNSTTFHEVKAGVTYSLSESVSVGYSGSWWTCTGGEASGNTVKLSPGEQVTCSITNDDIAPTLKVVKNVINDNGGNATIGDFEIKLNGALLTFDSGTTDGSKTVYTAAPTIISNTSYTLSEKDLVGYQEGAWTCVNDVSGALYPNPLTIDEGQSITCTITNNDIAPKLTIVKKVINDNGGTLLSDDFGLTVGENSVYSGIKNSYMANKEYQINETPKDGYEFVSITGDAKCPSILGGYITLDEGDDITCTITNNDIFGKVTVYKFNDLNANGVHDANEPYLPDWMLNLTGQTSVNTNANGMGTFNQIVSGNYDLSENLKEGWYQSGIYCDDGQGTLITAPGEAYGHHGACEGWNGYDAPTLAKWACETKGYSNLVSYGAQKPCPEFGQCNLFYGGHGDGVQMNWTKDYGGYCGVMGVTDIVCNNGESSDGSVKDGGYSATDKKYQITVDPSKNRTCYIGNYQKATITINKNVINYDETDIGNTQPFTVDGGQVLGTSTFSEDSPAIFTVNPGTYNFSEINIPNNYELTSENNLSATVTSGGQATLTFINKLNPPPTATISKTNDASGDLNPGSSVGYKIKVNISGNDVSNFKVTDLLSNGFKYRPGSYNILINGVNMTVGISEPQYHSPGVWNIGNLKAGDVVELSYLADINSDQQPGTYRDLAYAFGQSTYGDHENVLASATPIGYVDENFVGTEVPIVKSTQSGVSAGVEHQETSTGEVLGVSTELPSTGSNTLWLLIALLMSTLGLGLIKKSGKKILPIIIFALFIIFPDHAQAIANLSLRVEQPKTPINTSDVNLNFVALDINNDAVTVRCYKKSPLDSSYTQFGSDIVLSAGGNANHCSLAPILTTEGTYQFYLTATSSTTVTSSTISLDYKTSSPGAPVDYRKEHPNNCDYKIHFKTADDSGRTVKVELYRSDLTNFLADSGSVVSSVSVGSNEERDVTNSVPDCNKNYYYVIRAFDAAGNGSAVVGDSVTVSTSSSTTTTVSSGTTTTAGAIPVTGVNLPSGTENLGTSETTTNNQGQVLGVENFSPSFLKKYWPYMVTLALIIIAIIGYGLLKKKQQSR